LLFPTASVRMGSLGPINQCHLGEPPSPYHPDRSGGTCSALSQHPLLREKLQIPPFARNDKGSGAFPLSALSGIERAAGCKPNQVTTARAGGPGIAIGSFRPPRPVDQDFGGQTNESEQGHGFQPCPHEPVRILRKTGLLAPAALLISCYGPLGTIGVYPPPRYHFFDLIRADNSRWGLRVLFS
jgi:hypothetical protein